MQPKDSRKKILMVFFVLVLITVFGLLLIFIYLRSATLVIKTEPGAEIFVTTKRDGEYKKIGEGEASFKSRTVPVSVYVMVASGDKNSISGVVLDKKGATKTREINLEGRKEAAKVTDGSVSSMFISGSTIQGIQPNSYQLVSFNTKRFEPPRDEFIGVPYLKKAVWYDKDNFIYNTFREGVGRFINSKDVQDRGLAEKIIGENGHTEDRGDNHSDELRLIDIAGYSGKPLALLSTSSLFTSENKGKTIRKIANFDSTKYSVGNVFTSPEYIFRFAGDLPAAYADEGEVKDADKLEEHTSSVTQYSYSGDVVNSIEINAESLVGATSMNNKQTFLLDHENITYINNKAVEQIPLRFGYVRDVYRHDKEVYCLLDNGLWKISSDGFSLQLVYEFSESSVGLEGSLTSGNKGLYFGTTTPPESTSSQSITFLLPNN